MRRRERAAGEDCTSVPSLGSPSDIYKAEPSGGNPPISSRRELYPSLKSSVSALEDLIDLNDTVAEN